MKKFLLLFITAFVCIWCNAQTYNSRNSINRIALVYYYQDENGFFHKKENVNLNEVVSIVSTYGYDKKSHELYVETDRANCVVTVTDEYHKLLKKSKSIPQLKGEELSTRAAQINASMAERYTRLNQNRQKHITDSIEKVRQDSIRKVKEDSIRDAQKKAQLEQYVSNHRWQRVPINDKLYCTFCEENVKEDTVSIYAIKNDSIYWFDLKWGYLLEYYDHVHAAKIPTALKNSFGYRYHCTAFADTIQKHSEGFSTLLAKAMNAKSFFEYLDKLQKEAPNGFFLSWGWDCEYSSLEFNFKYMNTNKNTIKYIEVFFAVTNDVGDVRKTGSFRGTGPVEQWESAGWNWDHSSYYVAGDASKMSLTKVVITYMNGSKVTIPKAKIKYDHGS